MQATSDLWKQLWENPLHEEETKLQIAGQEYNFSDIVDDSLKISGGMFDGFDIGNCAARQLDVEINPKGTIPKHAEIKVFKRLAVHETKVSNLEGVPEIEHIDQYSEWLPNGVFYISTRQKNRITEGLTIHAFDAMLKAGAPFLAGPEYGAWPRSETQVATEIAAAMGVTLDPRTKLDNKFPVGYPVDENGEMTMTDILEGIAVANCGNWIITDAGQLLLRKLGDIPEETNYLVEEYGHPIAIGGVVILV